MEEKTETKEIEYTAGLLARLADAARILAGRGNIALNFALDKNADRIDALVKPLFKRFKESKEYDAYMKALDPRKTEDIVEAASGAKKKKSKKLVVTKEEPVKLAVVDDDVRMAFEKLARETDLTKVEFTPYKIKMSRLPDTLGPGMLSDLLKPSAERAMKLRDEAEKCEDEKQKDAKLKMADKIDQQVNGSPPAAIMRMIGGDTTFDGLFRWFYRVTGCVEDDSEKEMQ